jgi:hypothetical protein
LTLQRRRNLARFGAAVILLWLLGWTVFEDAAQGGLRNSDWPTFMIFGRLAVSDAGHLYDRDAQRRQQLAILGQGGYSQNGQPPGLLGAVAPPWVAFLAAPFAALGLVAGGLLWTLTEFAALLAGLALLARRVWDAVFAAAGIPAWIMLANAQLDGLVVLGLGLAWRLHRERPLLAGLALGLTLVKPHLVLVLPLALLLRRRWAVLAGWAVSAAILVGATELVDSRLSLAWLDAATSQAGRIGADLTPAGIGYLVSPEAGLALAALGALAALLLARRPAALLAGTLLAAPHGLFSDLTLLSAGTAAAGRARPLELGAVSGGAIVLVLVAHQRWLEALLGSLLILGLTWRLGR